MTSSALAPLSFLSRHGRLALPLGLAAGLGLPGLAAGLKPWLPELVLGLLFLSSFRLAGPIQRRGIVPGRQAVGAVLVLQLALPMAAIAVFALAGLAATPAALAVILVLSAPSVTGSPNFTQLMGHDPDPAFRLLLLGTGLLPPTVAPIFWVTPALGDFAASLTAALTLLASISVTVGLALLLRRLAPPRLSSSTGEALDGLMVGVLIVMVIGLMSALGPALLADPWLVARWLALALSVNLGLQVVAFLVLRRSPLSSSAVPYSVVAGNRNFALFLVALPDSTVDHLLIFLGCYQVPMYLTPLIMHRFYTSRQ